MKSILLLITLTLMAHPFCVQAEEIGDKEPVIDRWSIKRGKMIDLYFPHKDHLKPMKNSDPCMSCHPFTGNNISDVKTVDELTVIANEPLKSICHSCHVDDLSAPSECVLCHKQPGSIWPDDHNYNYIEKHVHDASLDSESCNRCHVNVSFCTDCHFRRDSSKRRVHSPAYRGSHGLDARISTGKCGKCHSRRYCGDCHGSVR